MKTITVNFIVFYLLFALSSWANAKPDLELYLGKPYFANPLGEGPNSPYAKGPIFRDDGFDCTTYVETVLAKVKAKNSKQDFLNNIKQLRYIDGKVDFFSRAHLMEYHWIPNAIKYEFISPYNIAGTKKTNFQLGLRQWFLENKEVKFKDQTYIQLAKLQPTHIQTSIPYIQSKKIDIKLLNSLPNFMVVFFIKSLPSQTWPGQNQEQECITHMGLLIDKNLYHASRTNKSVSQINLIDYLRNKPSFIGVSFYNVNYP